MLADFLVVVKKKYIPDNRYLIKEEATVSAHSVRVQSLLVGKTLGKGCKAAGWSRCICTQEAEANAGLQLTLVCLFSLGPRPTGMVPPTFGVSLTHPLRGMSARGLLMQPSG